MWYQVPTYNKLVHNHIGSYQLPIHFKILMVSQENYVSLPYCLEISYDTEHVVLCSYTKLADILVLATNSLFIVSQETMFHFPLVQNMWYTSQVPMYNKLIHMLVLATDSLPGNYPLVQKLVTLILNMWYQVPTTNWST